MFGFFTGDRIRVAGEKMSLNRLEKEKIIKGFKEPRIHFAVNCASVSCPPLYSEPFTAEQLETQLDLLTRRFLNNNPQAVRLDQERYLLSSIFDWYEGDFKASGGVLAFINRYRSQPIPEKSKIGFMDYDWKLNEVN
jgi:hypothetical protein